jgi:hypothetical protein
MKILGPAISLGRLRRRIELGGINGYTSMAKTTGATLPATGLHGPINGIRFQLILRTHR